ncbi:membrane-associated phospholipid phosphatase [Secundilactobacillus oryzae JCM 18671]|uniref:Membrane-associated phospholipid phosphatase n=2 Tax=Secundilactobacillus oryzae TaxID=1202668 RepID=A0A081BKL7_9LACO|nr:membrane-associated phospholipid phosphatase [Secundilactobacillus oryzae JCM 18671]
MPISLSWVWYTHDINVWEGLDMIYKERTRILRFLISGVLFGWLMILVMNKSGILDLIDTVVQRLVQDNESALKHGLFTLISGLASPTMTIVWTLVLAFLLWGFKYKIPALWALCTLLGGDVIAKIVKEVVQRARPFDHLAADDGFSFPSGHVFGFFILVALLWILVVPMMQNHLNQIYLRAFMILLLFLVAMSRVYLSAHYPSDTVGAMLLAYAWIQVAEWLYLALAPMMKKWSFLKNSKI